jgi:nucleotide-binding universal stress UspA family protein
VVGSVASEILHRAPQSVLLARPGGGGFGTIVAGVDGSPASLAALEAARALAGPGAVWVVAAEGGKPLERDALAQVPGLEWDAAHPVAALVRAAEPADLLVVGSRGLHGLAALGSVSERVAHRANCSVLVVRDTHVEPDVRDKRERAAVR